MSTYNRLYRSRRERMVFGVAGGLGEYFNIDPTLIRLLFVFLALIGGHGVLVYLILALVVPEEPVQAVVAPPPAAEPASPLQNDAL